MNNFGNVNFITCSRLMTIMIILTVNTHIQYNDTDHCTQYLVTKCTTPDVTQ